MNIKNNNLALAEQLYNLGYSVIASNNKFPLYKYKDFYKNAETSYNQLLSYRNRSDFDCLLLLATKNIIILDVDSPRQIEFLSKLSKKYNIASNLVVKTRNGYHPYYSINYEVRSSNGSNDTIAIKCNMMSITAPLTYRSDKQHHYRVMQDSIPNINDLVLMPEEMYKEIKEEQERSVPTAPIKTNPLGFDVASYKPTNSYARAKSGYIDKTISEYLNKLNIHHYLFGELSVWLQLLAACKKLDPGGEDETYSWSCQGKYTNMSKKEFSRFWRASKGVFNGGAWLTTAIKNS